MDQTENQEPDILSKFKLAIIISKKDREVHQNNQVNEQQLKQKNDYHEVRVNNGQIEQKILLKNDIDLSACHKEIELHQNNSNSELHHDTSNLVKDTLIHHQQEPVAFKAGILMKKSPHFLQGWQQRYVVLKDNVLKYYELSQVQGQNGQLKSDFEGIKPFGILNFDSVSFQLRIGETKQSKIVDFIIFEQRLQPKNSQKLFQFKSNTSEETQHWYISIENALKNSQGYLKNLTGLSGYYRFWRTDRITYRQSLELANTGDVVLFRGKSANCSLQRIFTGSDYDHVGMILRYSQGRVYVLEAAGFYGVGLFKWSDMVTEMWYELYDKLMLRRLQINRDQAFLDKMQDFVQKNLGKKYSCAPQKLLKAKSTIVDLKKQDEQEQKTKKERTYFCSELVAAAYKSVGLLPQEKSSAQYWPGSFASEKENLQLLGSARLLPEVLIDFTSSV